MNNIPTNGNDLILPSDSTGLTRLSFGNNLMYAIPAGNRLFINGSTSANITSFIETNFQSFSVDEECLAMNKECDSDQTKITCGGGSWTYEIAVKLQDANLNQIFYKQCPFSYCLPNSELNFINVSIYDSFGDGMNGNVLKVGTQVITFDHGHYYNVIYAGGSLNPTPPPTREPTRGARTLFPTKAPSGQSNGNEKEVEEISLPIVFFSLGLSILVCYCFYLKYLGYTRTPLNEDDPVHNPMTPDDIENIDSGNPIINNKSTSDVFYRWRRNTISYQKSFQ